MIKNIWKPIGQLYFNVFLNPLKFNGTLVINDNKSTYIKAAEEYPKRNNLLKNEE